MIVSWFFGFHAPSFRNSAGRIDPRVWLGHCEAWGFTEDRTWLFLDPQGIGTMVRVMHKHDDVQDALLARSMLCKSILSVSGGDPAMRFPAHGVFTCASICGSLVGIRALLPASLERKLRRNGAKVIHEAEGRPQG